ncbi:hypothetical protein WA026_002952 [Henosepilachna vigintioctopunctata]|uniref:Uncharacterized protein n=1 Tax=Henosepilachna vigintioctopunctata TaxID=420089 RepID=A0AAW1TH00_9CUCU
MYICSQVLSEKRPSFNMKSIILFAFVMTLYLVGVESIKDKDKCKCWPDFVPEIFVGHYHCRGLKHKRLFECNEPQPPLCRCIVNGKDIFLDLGESHCLSVKEKGHRCENDDEFDEFFANNPHLRIHYLIIGTYRSAEIPLLQHRSNITKTMKFFLTVSILLVLFNAFECTSPACGCWEGYEASSEAGKAVCRGKKTGRIFDCNEPDIPLCECSHNGKVHKQELGITDCASVNGKKDCDNAKDFEGYFQRHPEKRILI